MIIGSFFISQIGKIVLYFLSSRNRFEVTRKLFAINSKILAITFTTRLNCSQELYINRYVIDVSMGYIYVEMQIFTK